MLLDRGRAACVERVERSASGEALAGSVVVADAVLAQPPAEQHLFIVEDGGEIEQTDLQILHDASGGMNIFEGALYLPAELIVARAQLGDVGLDDQRAAEHADAAGHVGETLFNLGESAAAFHG